MKKSLLVAVIIFLLGLSRLASAQVSPTMYTLDDIYYYLADGTESTAGSHSLQPPSGAVPGDTRFKTLKQIYELANAEFGKCDATADDVKEGAQFYSTEPGSWGVQTGVWPGPWYEIYGPEGTNDVVQIGSMYVARDRYGAGGDYGNTKTWMDTQDWADGLTWLEKGPAIWRIPTRVEWDEICDNKALLFLFPSYYWTADCVAPCTNNAYAFYVLSCFSSTHSLWTTDYVLAVCDVP